MKFLKQTHTGHGQYFSALDELRREIEVLRYLTASYYTSSQEGSVLCRFNRLHEVIEDEEEDEIALILDFVGIDKNKAVGPIANYDENLYSFSLNPQVANLLLNSNPNSSPPSSSSKMPQSATNFMLNEEQMLYCMKELAEGLSFLHQHNVCHRDIKPENLLVKVSFPSPSLIQKPSLHIIYCDFGCAEYFDRKENPQALVSDTAGTVLYWAPECLDPGKFAKDIDVGLDLTEDNDYGVMLDDEEQKEEKQRDYDPLDFSGAGDSCDGKQKNRTYQYSGYSLDVWSLGITFYNLFYHSFPFPIRGVHTRGNSEEGGIMDQIQEICQTEPSFRLHPQFRNKLDSDGEDWRERGRGIILEIVEGMLQKEPAMRWSLDNVLDRLDSISI